MSFLNTSFVTHSPASLPAHITLPQILTLLHNPARMLAVNPQAVSHTQLSPEAADAFFKNEKPENKPTPESPATVWNVVEDMAGEHEGGAGSWRGGWAKRFIPEKIEYVASFHPREDGVLTVTHAPMGVHNTTLWVVKKAESGEGWILDERGEVTSNRMLMTFIKTTMQASHDKLVHDVVNILLAEAEGKDGKINKEGKSEEAGKDVEL